MRRDWVLPDECDLRLTGTDWALIILDAADRITRQRLLFIWWRAWHLRNDIIFGDGTASLEASTKFILSYSSVMENLKSPDDILGRCLDQSLGEANSTMAGSPPALECQLLRQSATWKPPDSSQMKLNTNASFIPSSGDAWWGAGGSGRVRMGRVREL